MSDLVNVKPIPMEVLRALRGGSEIERKQVSLWMPSWQENTPARTSKGFDAAVREGWSTNELVFACIMKTAKARAMVSLGVEDRRTDKELPEHPFRKLLRRPNPHMTEYGFHAAVTIYQKLSGHSYWEVIRSRAGLPAQLWPLRPDWVSPILSSRGLMGWEYRRGGQQHNAVMLAPQDVIDIPIFDPRSLFGGTAPVMVAGYAIDIDNAVNRFAKDFFERGALPAGILSSKLKLQTNDVDAIRAMWSQRYGGSDNWLTAPAVLDQDATYQRIAMSFEEMGFEALDSRDEARICMVLDIPPIVVGANIGLERSTYSNSEQAETSWWRNSIIPDLKHEADVLQTLADEWGDIDLEWDFSDVPAVQEDAGQVWTRARETLQTGAVTIDEYREMIGLEELPNGSGQIFLRPMNVIEVPFGKTAADVEAAQLLALPDNTPPPADGTPTDDTNPDTSDASQA